MSTPWEDHNARLAAGQACLAAALHVYLPRGLSITCCCDPDHIGVGDKHGKTCDSPGKMPMHTWKHLQERLPIPEEVHAAWRRYPYGNVGAVLGQISGLVRVDVDSEAGEVLLQQWSAGDLPPTWTFRSSPNGRGVLYGWPREVPCKTTAHQTKAKHEELRLMANGSQTILPPSRHPSGSLYTWEPGHSPDDIPLAPAPAWLVERLRQEPRQKTSGQTAATHEPPEYARVASALAAIPNEDAAYDDWLTLGMALHSTGEAWARGVWDDWSQQSGKYDEGKQEKTWASFTPDGPTQLGSMFHMAKAQGWSPPPATLHVNGTPPQSGAGPATNGTPLAQDALLIELAALSPLEYDRRRTEAAKLLGVRVGTLDAEVTTRRQQQAAPQGAEAGGSVVAATPAPWTEAVDGAQLLTDLVTWYRRYVVLPEGAAEGLALWTLHTYTMDAAQVTPRLAIVSPQKRCGKTTLMALLGAVTASPLPAANITAAALFRAIEQWRPTMLIDEADTFLQDNEELRGVLNAGHYRPSAFVVRAVPVGDSWEPRKFGVWGPVAIALIGNLHSTLADRSITIRLRRKTAQERVERLRLDRLGDAEALRRRCLRWGHDHLAQLRECDPPVPEMLNDRAADNWRSLCAIAEVAGGDWAQRVARAVKVLSPQELDDEAAGVMLLEDLWRMFTAQNVEKLSSEEIVTTLRTLEERPWSEWGRHEKPITARQVARLLAPFGIKSKTIRLGLDETPKGYEREVFVDAWTRYLPILSSSARAEELAATPPQTSNGTGLSDIISATLPQSQGDDPPQPSNNVEMSDITSATYRNDANVADRNGAIPASYNGCGGVADHTPYDVVDRTSRTPASLLDCGGVAEESPLSGGKGIADHTNEHSPPEALVPCFVCGVVDRWHDVAADVWRCRKCWPPAPPRGVEGEGVVV